PQFGILPRVSVLLDLVLDPSEMTNINIHNVKTAMNWRNKVIHKTGHIPRTIPQDLLRRNIVDVLKLVRLLGRKRDQIEGSPKLQRIGHNLSQKFGLPVPTILRLPRHHILVDFYFILQTDLPSDIDGVLKSIAAEASCIFAQEDTRFNACEHLYIRFLVFPQQVTARWRSNKVEIVE
ncbi:MAG: hypothetical protein WBD99_07750, partial [Thermodesulfobacteriota bacterium]